MSALVTMIGGSAVTTTVAISEGTDNQHKNVLGLVRAYLADLEEFGGVAFETRPFETHGGVQQRDVAILNEQQATLILTYMRNNEIVRGFKKRLVKEFWSMDQQRKSPSLNPANLSRLQLIQIAMQAEQERLALEEKVEKIQPMADALIRIAHTEGGRCLTDASKVLQIKPREFISKLAQMGWIYKRAGVTNWIGYQDKVNAGYLEHKLTTVERADGSEKSYAQCLVTPKGVAKLSLLFAHKTACGASTAEV